MIAPAIRFSEFSAPWRSTTLGDECSFSKGKGISKADIDPEGATPCVRYGQLYTDYGTVIGDVISHTSVDQALLRMSEGGEVIIPASGEDSKDIATAAVVINKGVALGGDLNILTTDHDGHFLAEYLSGKKRMDLAVLAQGNSVVHLYPKQLSGVAIEIPTLPEQRRIADALSAVDAKINLLARKRDNLARFKAGLMQKVFSQEVRFTREDGSAYPDWEEKELGDIAAAKTSSRSVGSIPDEEGRCAVYGATGIITRITSYDVKGEHIGIVKDGAGVGRVMMCEAMSSITGTLVSLTAKNGFCLRYLHQYLQTIDFSSYITGSTIPHIYFRDYKHERSNHPCWEEQVRISSFLDSFDSRVALVNEKISTMQSFKKGLLQQMFV